jgi:hypothetical protein
VSRPSTLVGRHNPQVPSVAPVSVADELTKLAALVQQGILSRQESWSGIEMALPDHTVPCLQMLVLGLSFGDGTLVDVGTYQDDDVWGLRLRPGTGHGTADRDGIYRSRVLSELPTGGIDDVSAVVEDGVLAEVVLRIDGRPLLLMAGEGYETTADRVRMVRLDESVLVFIDPSAADSLGWTPPRRPAAGSGRF